jgi:hypothetical protein
MFCAKRGGVIVSTPEERLSNLAEQLSSNRPDTAAAFATLEQQERRQSMERLRTVAMAYSAKALDFIAAASLPLYHTLEYSMNGTSPGFIMHFGHYALLLARTDGDGWRVRTRSRVAGLSDHVYASDEDVLAARDTLLEPLVADVLRALATSRQELLLVPEM